MKNKTILFTLFLALTICLFSVKSSLAGIQPQAGQISINLTESDTPFLSSQGLVYFFDLRDRETFVQFTYPDIFELQLARTGLNATAHVQIFDVSNNCSENNFFDVYTPADTHVYNIRDIQTNDGNPSGVVLPSDAYGFVVITALRNSGGEIFERIADPIGNFRVLDNNGYEYRTNALTISFGTDLFPDDLPITASTFNFNNQGGVTLSDVVGINMSTQTSEGDLFIEWQAEPVQAIYSPYDIDIYDLNETPFSCRDIIFACVNEDNPLLEELLTVAGTANVASFEYGINNAIPHSKGGELLCPGNIVSEGIVRLTPEPYSQAAVDIINSNNLFGPFFFAYVGLNNGNGRGSMDSFWTFNFELIED